MNNSKKLIFLFRTTAINLLKNVTQIVVDIKSNYTKKSSHQKQSKVVQKSNHKKKVTTRKKETT